MQSKFNVIGLGNGHDSDLMAMLASIGTQIGLYKNVSTYQGGMTVNTHNWQDQVKDFFLQSVNDVSSTGTLPITLPNGQVVTLSLYSEEDSEETKSENDKTSDKVLKFSVNHVIIHAENVKQIFENKLESDDGLNISVGDP